MPPLLSDRTANSPFTNRWLQLPAGIARMVVASRPRQSWTLFVEPIDARFQWGRAAIQADFAILVLAATLLVPFEGWFVDRFGPRPVAMLGGVLVGASWVLNSVADSLSLFYLGAALGGL